MLQQRSVVTNFGDYRRSKLRRWTNQIVASALHMELPALPDGRKLVVGYEHDSRMFVASPRLSDLELKVAAFGCALQVISGKPDATWGCSHRQLRSVVRRMGADPEAMMARLLGGSVSA